jgi:hypothetical protein
MRLLLLLLPGLLTAKPFDVTLNMRIEADTPMALPSAKSVKCVTYDLQEASDLWIEREGPKRWVVCATLDNQDYVIQRWGSESEALDALLTIVWWTAQK